MTMMNKSEMVDQMAAAADISKAAAARALDAFLNGVKTAVADGDDATFIGFGTFTSSKRAARTGRKPGTGESIEIPEAVVPKFRPGAEFKKAVMAGKGKS